MPQLILYWTFPDLLASLALAVTLALFVVLLFKPAPFALEFYFATCRPESFFFILEVAVFYYFNETDFLFGEILWCIGLLDFILFRKLLIK